MGDMERGAFIQGVESAIQQAAQRMGEAQQNNDLVRFRLAADAWRQAQILWLQATQNMTSEKAEAVMIGFAAGGELDKWANSPQPGPPPSVLSLYPKWQDQGGPEEEPR
jgi:hypothetical protein